MKFSYLKLTIGIIIEIIPLFMFAGGFNNVNIIPPNPTINDSVKIAYAYIFVNNPALIFDRLVNINGYQIQVEICCGLGQKDAGVTVFDTINLGVLPIGSYSTVLHLDLTALSDTGCINSFLNDSIIVGFNVNSPNSVRYIDNGGFQIFPNPTTKALVCSRNFQNAKSILQIMNMEGKIIMQIFPPLQKSYEIDVGNLPPGIYFLQSQDDRESWIRKFVKE